MENLQIAFSLHTDVPKKQVEQEIARQQKLLSDLTTAEQTEEVIAATAQVQENIRLLQAKRKNAKINMRTAYPCRNSDCALPRGNGIPYFLRAGVPRPPVLPDH